MKGAAMLSALTSVFTLCCTGFANAAPAHLEQTVELLEARCKRGTANGLAAAPRSSTLPDDPSEPPSRSLDRNMRATRDAMLTRSPSAQERAAAQRACEEAAARRADLALWVDRRALAHEAIWEAVVAPISAASSDDAPPPALLALSSPRLSRLYEERLDRLLDEIDIAERDRAAVTAYATKVMESFYAATSENLLCERQAELTTGADVYRVLNEAAARAAAVKQQLLAGLWDELNVAAAAKINAYAMENAPIVSERSAEYYADWTPQQIEDLLAFACREAPLRENASVEGR